MTMRLSRKRVVAAVLVLVVVASGAAAYTTVFTAGSGTSYETDSGLVVSTSTDHGLDNTNPFNGTEEVYINDLSVTASGDAAVTIDQFEGATTQLSGIDASSNTVTVDPGDKPSVNISGNVTDLSWSSASLDDDATAFTYSSSGSGTVTMTGLNASEDWTAATSNGELVDSGTTSASGEAEINVNTATDEDVILFTNHAPEAVNLSPPNGTKTTESTVNFTADVSDTEFSTAQGDEVTAELFVDGESVGSQTVTSNQTVTVSHSLSEGGDHSYYWRLEDSYGKSTTSETLNITVPDALYIYNETAPGQLVDDSNATVSFYFDRDDRDDLVVDRNATNGEVDLSGLPANEQFIAVVSADGYFNRRIYVQSLYETQSIYMLNETVDAVQPTFQLTDFTGSYPLDSSVLEIQKNINGTWQNVEGDYFGATNQFNAVLQFNERHRLIIRNTRTGQSRDLGIITPVDTSRVAVEVYQDSETVDVETRPQATFEPSVGSVAAFDSVNISADVRSNADSFESYTLVATANGTELANISGSNPDGEVLSAVVDLSGHAGDTLEVEATWVTENGETGSDSHTLVINEAYGESASLVSVLTGLGTGQTSGLAALMALFLTAIAIGGAATRMPSEAAAGVGVLVFGGFMLLNWVEIGWFFAVAMTWLVFTAMRRPV